MARPLRLELADGWYHVTGRGNERKAVFRDEADRDRFVELLGRIEARYGVEVHGYVLMDNHYHLLLRLKGESGLSAAMQWLLVSYTVWFNRRHRRAGHLFQGRFKAILVEFDQWGASLSRYIHLNPVRVRKYGLDKMTRAAQRNGLGDAPTRDMVRERLKALRTYRWSSYRQYVGSAKPMQWLHTETVLPRFGRNRQASAYRQFVEESIRAGRDESPWEELKAGFVLGSGEFVEKSGKLLKGNPREQPGLRKLAQAVSLNQIARAVSDMKGKNGRISSICEAIGDATWLCCWPGKIRLRPMAAWRNGSAGSTTQPCRKPCGAFRPK